MEGRRRGRRRWNTPRHQYIQLVLPLTPAANAGQRRRSRPRDASAARPIASACHAGFWSSVSTARSRLDRNRRGARGSQRGRGQGSASGEGGKRSRHTRRIKRRGRNQGKRRRRKARESRTGTRIRRRHQRMARGQRETSQAITQPQRTYISGRSTETEFMPIEARIWTEASVTTWRGRRGGTTSQSCYLGAMTR